MTTELTAEMLMHLHKMIREKYPNNPPPDAFFCSYATWLTIRKEVKRYTTYHKGGMGFKRLRRVSGVPLLIKEQIPFGSILQLTTPPVEYLFDPPAPTIWHPQEVPLLEIWRVPPTIPPIY